MALPVCTLALPLLGIYARILRSDLVAQPHEDYILTVRAAGASRWQALSRHALRNALFGSVTVVGLSLGTLLGATVVIEQFFALPGIGSALLQHKVVPGGPQFEVIVVHHNQCGTHFLAEPEFRHGFAQLMGVEDETALEAEAVVDPAATVKVDVDLVLTDSRLPRTITVSGRVYDVTTGLLTPVVPTTAMPAA